MIPENSDQIALTAQADIHRFFTRVIRSALVEFSPGIDPLGGIVDDINVFLDRAAATTHNAVCYELRRAFSLVIASAFERQLRQWLFAHHPDRGPEIERANWNELKSLLNSLSEATLTVAGVEDDVDELWLVANAVRHGDGRSLKRLADVKPSFWAHFRAVNGAKAKPSLGEMRISDGDLERYIMAIMRFWAVAGASSVPGGIASWDSGPTVLS